MKGILRALLAAALVFVPAASNAQTKNVQAHPVQIKAKVLSQRGAKVDKDSVKETDIGALCTAQAKLQKGQGLTLRLNDACGEALDLNNNLIQVIQQTPSYKVLATIGRLVCAGPNLVSEKNATRRGWTRTCTVDLCCSAGGTCNVLDVEMSGVLETRFKSDGICVHSLKGSNFGGNGTVGDDDVILESGKFDAKKPFTSIGVE